MFFKNKSKDKKSNTRFESIGALGFDGMALKNILSPVHMDIKSDREAVVEGCSGVEEYDENTVRIKAPKMVISFFGQNLAIKCLNTDSLVIEGKFSSIEFDK